jgi:V/A-type H+-transporting ATPase subunit I
MLSVRQVTKLFGDVLSYLRLFALGLASSTLALTFNDLARSAADSIPGLGILVGLVIILTGHVINLTLAVLGGLVHGLRLNLIEFLSWGGTGEGYPFRAFRSKDAQA